MLIGGHLQHLVIKNTHQEPSQHDLGRETRQTLPGDIPLWRLNVLAPLARSYRMVSFGLF